MGFRLSSIIDRQSLKRLNEANNLIAAGDLIKRILLNVALLWMLIEASTFSYMLALPIWYFYALQIHFWGYAGLGHEAFHGKIFSSKKVNKILFKACSAITWNNSALFEKSHWFHHGHTFSEDDAEARSEQNWSAGAFVRYFLVDYKLLYRRLLYTIINALGFYPNLTPIGLDARLAAQQNLLFNTILYACIYAISGSIFVTILIFISPFSASVLNKILAKAQHHALFEFRKDGPLKFSRTLRLPKWLCFLYANMNYHAEHHLAPSIPYYNLPELYCILNKVHAIESISFKQFLETWNIGLTKPEIYN